MKYQWLTSFFLLATLSHGLTISDGMHEGQECFIISTISGTYYYQKAAGAFSSFMDGSGKDWVKYNTLSGVDPSSALRGLPSLVYADSIGHPGFSLCSSVKFDDTTIVTTTNDGLWEWQWTFSECQATMTMIKVPSGSVYSFKYNGPPADNYCSANYWGNDLLGFQPGVATGLWKWAYFGDSSVTRILFAGQQVRDALVDSYSSVDGATGDGMVSFGFGFDGSTELMNSADNSFTIGFLEQKVTDSASHFRAADAIEAIMYRETSHPLYGVSMTTHWSGKNQVVQGGWGKIVRHDIENDSAVNHTTLYSGKSSFPKINIEGTQTAFFILNDNKQGATVAVMDINGNNLKKLENSKWNESPSGGFIDWPEGRWIYYLPSYGPANEIFRVHADNGTVEKVMTFKTTSDEPTHPWIWTMSADGSRMTFRATDFRIYFLSVPTTFPAEIVLDPAGGLYNSPTEIYGCQHSISASGNYICYGPPGDMHTTIRIKQWEDGSKYGTLKKFNAPQLHSWAPSQADVGGTFYHNHWANNSDYWICAHEATNTGTYEVCNQVLYDWRGHRQVVATYNTGDTPDFDDAGDFHIDTSNIAGLPIIRLNKSLLSFEADSGLGNPDSQDVTVINGSDGTLDDIVTSIRYTAGGSTGWLSALKSSGSGNSQIITNAINITGLTGGNYRAVVTVSAPNARLAKIYSVSLKVNTDRVFSSVLIYPEQITIEPGDTSLFVAIALDQYGDTVPAQPPKWLWDTDSNGVIQYGLFTSGIQKSTPYTVTAQGSLGDITLAGTALATVELPILRVTAPNGGEVFKVGDTMTIEWECGDTTKISTVALELSIDNGKTWHMMDSSALSPQDPLWGSYPWIVPDSLGVNNIIYPISENCKIKLRDYQFPAYRDASDSLFTIKQRPNSIAENDPLKCKIRVFGIFQTSNRSFKILIPPAEKYAIDIVGVNGRTMLSQRGTGSCSYTVTRRNLAAGVYIVRVKADTKVLMKRLLLY